MYDYSQGVVGYDEVMGEEMGEDVLGALLSPQAVPKAQINTALLKKLQGGLLRLPPKPGWRNAVAPGVPGPGVGLWPLPLTPLANNGVFNAANNEITFQAQPQRPFQGQRMVAIIIRSAGAAAVSMRTQPIFIGTTPQAADIGSMPLDLFAPTAFGVRLQMQQATPGMLVRLIVSSDPVPAGETVAVQITLLGSVIS